MPMRLIIGVVALLVVVVAGAGILLGTRFLGGRAEAVDLPTWAHRVCTASTTYERTMLGVADNIDPTTLPLDERKERAERISNAQIEAAQAMAQELRALRPPESARPLHEAILRGKEEEVEATREQLEAVRRATDPQQIAVANANTRFRLQNAAMSADAAVQSAGEEVQVVLRDTPACQPQAAFP
jgi:hypothetical protein